LKCLNRLSVGKMSEDFYDVLGVGRDASEDDINAAYRKKAARYHPDVSDDPDAEEKFKRIKTAKEVLTDEEKRQAYDRMGHERFVQAEKRGGFDDRGGGGRAGAGGARGGDPFGGGGPFGGGSMGDIFEQFFGGGMSGRGQGQRRGRDLRTELAIDLEEAYHGAGKEITVARPERCSDCGGRGHPPDADSEPCPNCQGRGQVRQVQQTPLGRVQQTSTCPRCEGEGQLYNEQCSTCGGQGQTREESTLTVEIPAGIQDGQTLRMDGEGTPAPDRGPNGDLLIDVTVAEDERFERDDDDLHHRLAISVPRATFGDTVTVPTVDSSEELEIPTGTQSGETFKIRGEGMPRLRGRGHGDLYVHVQVVTPTDLNEEQREALEAFAEAGGEEIEVKEGFWEKIRRSL
jgi:molecular chaperone DnaJ